MSDLERAVERYFAHNAFHECCFALTVSSNESDLFTSPYGQVNPTEDTMLAISLANLITDDGEITASHRAGELEVQGTIINLINFNGHNLLQLSYLLLNLNGLCSLITEALNESPGIGYLLLLVLQSPQLLLTSLSMKGDVFVVLDLVIVYFAATDFYRSVCHIINKCSVVADEYNGIGTGG